MEKSKKSKNDDTPVSKEKIMIYTAIAIVVIIIALVASIKLYTPTEKVPLLKYNGFFFTQRADFWHFDWQKDPETVYTVSLRFNPVEAAEVPLTGETMELFNQHLREKNEVFITFDPLADNFSYTALAAGELSLSIARALDITPYAACIINKTDTCIDRPIVTCDSKEKAVIYLDAEEDETKIIQKDNCLIISGRGLEKLRAIDRVLYHWYDIY
tara:strand:+ start:2981 stop:3622 length:642 start_codon:yes stop_codon:yes gene_type:complete